MRPNLPAILIAAVLGVSSGASAWAQDKPALAGEWTLDRALSEFPRELGFGAAMVSGASSELHGGILGSTLPSLRESEDDARRRQLLTAEVRDPSAHLTIAETATTVSITSDRGHVRTFAPNGREQLLQLDDVPVATIARWEGDRLVVLYTVREGRELRYVYSRNATHLVVDVEFIERGGGDKVRRVYQPGSAAGPAAAAASPPAAVAPAPPVSPAGVQPPSVAQGPDAELKGLVNLGLVVEDLSAQAAVCGLKLAAIETEASKSLTGAGFKVRRNADEDTYVYIHVMTASLTAGLCVSRYDAFLYTHTTATLSHQPSPVLVQVSLLHKGGIAGGSPTTHADEVLRGVRQYVDQFAARIRNANK